MRWNNYSFGIATGTEPSFCRIHMQCKGDVIRHGSTGFISIMQLGAPTVKTNSPAICATEGNRPSTGAKHRRAHGDLPIVVKRT